MSFLTRRPSRRAESSVHRVHDGSRGQPISDDTRGVSITVHCTFWPHLHIILKTREGHCMSSVKERFLVDEAGNRVAVVVSLEDYRQLLADVEELHAIRAYDAAKASEETPIPFVQAVAELERQPE